MPSNVKPPSCPACGCTKVVEIVYGFPPAWVKAAARQGELELGGCCIYEDSPSWACKICGHRFI